LNGGALVVLRKANGETPLHGNRISRRIPMDTRAKTALDIEAAASPAPLAALEANDRSERSPTPTAAGRAIVRWLIDSLAIAGAGMAGVYVGVLLDPSDVSSEQTDRKDGPDWIG
jgi:hypothetical protein